MKKRILGLEALAVLIMSCVVLAGCGSKTWQDYAGDITEYIENGEYDSALKLVDEVEDIPSKFKADYLEQCYEGKEMYDEAAQVYIDYYAASDESKDDYGYIKNVTLSEHMFYKAMDRLKDNVSDDMKNSVEEYISDMDNIIARYNQITEYMESENYDEALLLIDEAINDGTTAYDYYGYKADIYVHNGDTAAAISMLEDYINSGDISEDSYFAQKANDKIQEIQRQ